MPHKHKRKRGDEGDYELPPTQRARPLAVRTSTFDQEIKKRGKKRNKNQDDAPRAFRRIMAVAQGKKFRSGLDNGDGGNGKGKGKGKKEEKEPQETEKPEELRIRPGEDLRAFASRVDASLPVAGLTKKTIVKDGKDEQGLKVFRTRKERKMHMLYDQWRAEERKIQEKRDEELELEAERELEKNDGAGFTTTSSYILDDEPRGGKGKGKKKKGKEKDDDPWAVLKKKRAEGKVKVTDTAQAPPVLHKEQSRKLKVVGDTTVDVGSIPKAAGSLKRREELQTAREDVLEAYRKTRERRLRAKMVRGESP